MPEKITNPQRRRMEATVILTENLTEISRFSGILSPVEFEELKLLVAIWEWTQSPHGETSERLAQALLTASGAGLDVFMKEYGASQLQVQIKAFRDFLPR